MSGKNSLLASTSFACLFDPPNSRAEADGSPSPIGALRPSNFPSCLPLGAGTSSERSRMSKECAVANCAALTSGYSAHCERHKRAQRRHGHPEQTGVTVHELKAYRDRIAARRAKNPANPSWEILRERWAAVVVNAESFLKGHTGGKPGSAYVAQAAHHIKQLASTAPDAAVIDAALAMFLMREAEPKRFLSDRAFDFQLARRIRALTDVNAGTYFDHETGKNKRVYRDVLPGTLIALAEPLKAAFGVAGLYLAELDRRDEKRSAAKKMELMAALKGLE